MPRNIDPLVVEVQNVSLLTVDDLDRVLQDNLQRRLIATEQVEKIISNKVKEFYEAMNKNEKNILEGVHNEF
jgi:glutamyl-tRNA reductase